VILCVENIENNIPTWDGRGWGPGGESAGRIPVWIDHRLPAQLLVVGRGRGYCRLVEAEAVTGWFSLDRIEGRIDG
jgi:hypothetical protein